MKYILGAYSQMPSGTSDVDLEKLLTCQLKPVLTFLYQHQEFCFLLRLSLYQYEWLEKYHPEINMLIADLCRKNQLELLTSTCNDSILSLLPTPERSVYIEKTTTFLRRGFSKKPKGLWCYQQFFTPSVIQVLNLCSLDYVMVSGYNQDLNKVVASRPFYMDEFGKSSLVIPFDDRFSKVVFELTKYKASSEKFLSKIEKLTENTNSALSAIMLNLDQMLFCDGSVKAFELIFSKLGSNSTTPSIFLEDHDFNKFSYIPQGLYGRDFSLGKYSSINQLIVENPLYLKLYNYLTICRSSMKETKKSLDDKKTLENLLIKASSSSIFASEYSNQSEVREEVLSAVNKIEETLSNKDLLPFEVNTDSDRLPEYFVSNKYLNSLINQRGASLSRINLKANSHDYAFNEGNGVFVDSIRENKTSKVIDLSSKRFEITSLEKNRQDFIAKSSAIEINKQSIDVIKWYRFRQNMINLTYNLENTSKKDFKGYSLETVLNLNFPQPIELNIEDKTNHVSTSNNNLSVNVSLNTSEPVDVSYKNIYSDSNRFYLYTQIKIIKNIALKSESESSFEVSLRFDKQIRR